MAASLRILIAVSFLPALAGCGSVEPRASSPTAWHDLAAAREAVRIGDEGEAIRLLTHVVAGDPRRTEPRRRLGRLLLASDSPEAALVIAPLANRRGADPDDIVDFGFALLVIHDTRAARKIIRRLAADPGSVGPRAYVLQARIAHLEGDPDGAERALRHALALDPGHPEALAALVHLARERGDGAARAEAIEDLTSSCPWHPAVRRTAEPP
jgi:Flp pilus assembly protein TadD